MNKELSELYVVGPTASGKSSLAMMVAQTFNGEIVCADSQTIRKDLNIGTAKPSQADQNAVRHHMLDIIEPFEDFSVAEFQKMAREAIKDIGQRKKLPIIVGGSGMYVDSLYFNYSLNKQKSRYSRSDLEKMSISKLQIIIKDNNWIMPENSENPRHLIGLILRGGDVHNDRKIDASGKVIIGILPSDDTLKNRISERVEEMFENGFIEEVTKLLDVYDSFPDRLDAIGYPIAEKYIKGDITEEDAKALFKRGDWQYARKQKAWFKRNKNIKWFSDAKSAYGFVETLFV